MEGADDSTELWQHIFVKGDFTNDVRLVMEPKRASSNGLSRAGKPSDSFSTERDGTKKRPLE